MHPSPSVAGRIQEIRDRMAQAATRSGRKPADITLLVVSKTVAIEAIRQVYEVGLRDFGENRVQEALEKIGELPKDTRWHLIGRLQSNKINKALGKFVLVHSVDSFELARDISKRLQGATQDILVEVNTSGEETKAGLEPGKTIETLKKISGLQGLRLRGLMTIGPLTEDKTHQRDAFKTLKDLFEKAKAVGIGGPDFSILSMGMSGDFEMAIEEGSTMVRIGTALFGPRG